MGNHWEHFCDGMSLLEIIVKNCLKTTQLLINHRLFENLTDYRLSLETYQLVEFQLKKIYFQISRAWADRELLDSSSLYFALEVAHVYLLPHA